MTQELGNLTPEEKKLEKDLRDEYGQRDLAIQRQSECFKSLGEPDKIQSALRVFSRCHRDYQFRSKTLGKLLIHYMEVLINPQTPPEHIDTFCELLVLPLRDQIYFKTENDNWYLDKPARRRLGVESERLKEVLGTALKDPQLSDNRLLQIINLTPLLRWYAFGFTRRQLGVDEAIKNKVGTIVANDDVRFFAYLNDDAFLSFAPLLCQACGSSAVPEKLIQKIIAAGNIRYEDAYQRGAKWRIRRQQAEVQTNMKRCFDIFIQNNNQQAASLLQRSLNWDITIELKTNTESPMKLALRKLWNRIRPVQEVAQTPPQEETAPEASVEEIEPDVAPRYKVEITDDGQLCLKDETRERPLAAFNLTFFNLLKAENSEIKQDVDEEFMRLVTIARLNEQNLALVQDVKLGITEASPVRQGAFVLGGVFANKEDIKELHVTTDGQIVVVTAHGELIHAKTSPLVKEDYDFFALGCAKDGILYHTTRTLNDEKINLEDFKCDLSKAVVTRTTIGENSSVHAIGNYDHQHGSEIFYETEKGDRHVLRFQLARNPQGEIQGTFQKTFPSQAFNHTLATSAQTREKAAAPQKVS